jgi:hypothetical protein
MIVTKEVNVKIVSKNIVHFKNLGYDIKYGDVINVKIEDLLNHSYIKIKVKCDICGAEKDKPYFDYITLLSNQNFYSCQKCKAIKRKKTMVSKYGVEHALQNKDIMNKVKNTMINKHGAYCSAYSESIQLKNKNTIKNKYGVDYITQTEEFKENSKQTKLEKYGDENFVNSEKTKKTKLERYGKENYRNDEKIKKTNLEKYGADNPSQNDEIKRKKIETSIRNYGVGHPLQSEIVMNKMKKTNMDRYGFPHVLMSDKIINKTYKTNVENGRWVPKEMRSDFYKYSLIVYRLTRKNMKKLYEKWDGKDFYSGWNIKENLKLDSNDKDYPTIDHKLSIKYGFDNNILPHIISDINNLCITTRSYNSSKNSKFI